MARSDWVLAGLRTRLFVVAVTLILVAIIGVETYVSTRLEHDLTERVTVELSGTAALAALAVVQQQAFTPDAADRVVRTLGRASGMRVSLIDADGRIAADSSLAREAISGLESARDRPEFRDAMRAGTGAAWQESAGRSELLLAERVTGANGRPWIVRIETSSQIVDSARRAMRRLLLVASVLGLIAAAAISSVAVSLVAGPVRTLTSTARGMVRDLTLRAHIRSADEVGQLAAALDELADARSASLASLEEERDRLEAILEAMAEGVLVTDSAESIVLANRALREMFAVPREVVGREPIEAFRNAELHDAIAETIRTRASVTREITLDGGRQRKLLVRLALVDERRGGTVAVLTDVTELRRLETVRRDFVANVSHELRTPIAAVRAAVETLETGAVERPDAAREFLSMIARHAERLQNIVEDLLDLSRIEARQLEMSVESLDASAVGKRTVDLFRMAADVKHITLRVETARDVPNARANARALEQVISNLVDNAIKYSPEGREVVVLVGRGPRGVRLSVRDNGAGIDARHLPRVFERFYRVDPGRSRQVGGTGLGLAIVKHLAEAMDGSASVDSVVGKGSVFHVDLRAAGA